MSKTIFLILKFDFSLQQYFAFRYCYDKNKAKTFINQEDNGFTEYKIKEIKQL
ncbi:MAG: hypothetical protein R6U96_18615 [Promethearchaeia archaeon]